VSYELARRQVAASPHRGARSRYIYSISHLVLRKRQNEVPETVERAIHGWKVFEAPGVEPVFPDKDQAIDYADTRACFRSGEIRVLDVSGKLERTIAFNELNRKL
jgi:hypothetical protein